MFPPWEFHGETDHFSVSDQQFQRPGSAWTGSGRSLLPPRNCRTLWATDSETQMTQICLWWAAYMDSNLLKKKKRIQLNFLSLARWLTGTDSHVSSSSPNAAGPPCCCCSTSATASAGDNPPPLPLLCPTHTPLPPPPPAFPLCRRAGWEKFRASILRRKLPAQPWQKRVESITMLATAPHLKRNSGKVKKNKKCIK